MESPRSHDITDVTGKLQYRLALAGGWIDQPFASRLNPDPPGSMVVVAVEPQFRWMDRSGICGSTRQIALELWGGALPDRDPAQLVRELYEAENEGRDEPSGSQDMIGLIYPGVIASNTTSDVTRACSPPHRVVQRLGRRRLARASCTSLPVARVPAATTLETKNLDPAWIGRLGRSGCDCYNAIVARDIERLGASMNECMACWEAILPGTVRHPTLRVDLMELLSFYQSRYPGAMYSGCGGGYLFVASERPVPGAFTIQVRVKTP